MKGAIDMFYKLCTILIIILLMKLISNQHELDCHLEQIQKNGSLNVADLINNRGIINKIIWKLKVIFCNALYPIKKKIIKRRGSK